MQMCATPFPVQCGRLPVHCGSTRMRAALGTTAAAFAVSRRAACAVRGQRCQFCAGPAPADAADARRLRGRGRVRRRYGPTLQRSSAGEAIRRRDGAGVNQSLGNPLRLRRPLDKGVRIIMAHCASQVQRLVSTPCCNEPSRVLHSGLLRLAESSLAPPTMPVCVCARARVCVCACAELYVDCKSATGSTVSSMGRLDSHRPTPPVWPCIGRRHRLRDRRSGSKFVRAFRPPVRRRTVSCGNMAQHGRTCCNIAHIVPAVMGTLNASSVRFMPISEP